MCMLGGAGYYEGIQGKRGWRCAHAGAHGSWLSGCHLAACANNAHWYVALCVNNPVYKQILNYSTVLPVFTATKKKKKKKNTNGKKKKKKSNLKKSRNFQANSY